MDSLLTGIRLLLVRQAVERANGRPHTEKTTGPRGHCDVCGASLPAAQPSCSSDQELWLCGPVSRRVCPSRLPCVETNPPAKGKQRCRYGRSTGGDITRFQSQSGLSQLEKTAYSLSTLSLPRRITGRACRKRAEAIFRGICCEFPSPGPSRTHASGSTLARPVSGMNGSIADMRKKRAPRCRGAPGSACCCYGRSITNAGEVHVSQCAGFAASPSALSTDTLAV